MRTTFEYEGRSLLGLTLPFAMWLELVVPGVAANLLVGTDRLEPGTGQPISNGLSIRVERPDP